MLLQYNFKNNCSIDKKPSNKNTESNPHLNTHPFNGPLSGTTQVSQYQKGKTNLDFTEARDRGWQWHQLGHNASLHLAPDRQPHQHPTTLMFFTGWMPFLPPNQQRQSTEGNYSDCSTREIINSNRHHHVHYTDCVQHMENCGVCLS